MNFAIINPTEQTFEYVECEDIGEAYERAGLQRGEIDFGTVGRLPTRGGLGYVVYEFGMFVPPDQQDYFALGEALIAGPCVIYEFDERGTTVDLQTQWIIDPVFFEDVAEIELAISAGAIQRPRLAVNGDVFWEWPQPAPPEFAERVAQSMVQP